MWRAVCLARFVPLHGPLVFLGCASGKTQWAFCTLVANAGNLPSNRTSSTRETDFQVFTAFHPEPRREGTLYAEKNVMATVLILISAVWFVFAFVFVLALCVSARRQCLTQNEQQVATMVDPVPAVAEPRKRRSQHLWPKGLRPSHAS